MGGKEKEEREKREPLGGKGIKTIACERAGDGQGSPPDRGTGGPGVIFSVDSETASLTQTTNPMLNLDAGG